MNDDPLQESEMTGGGEGAAAPEGNGHEVGAPHGGPQLVLAPEDYPNYDALVTEDNTPVDNLYVEKQRRLQRADQEKLRADEQAERVRQLEAQLRALGIDPLT